MLETHTQHTSAIQPQRDSRSLKPIDTARARFDHQHFAFRPKRGNDQPGETRPCPKIEPGRCFTWNMGKQLRAVGDVAEPDIRQACRRYKILPLVLLRQQSDQPIEPGHRCIVAFRKRAQPGSGRLFRFDHAACRRA